MSAKEEAKKKDTQNLTASKRSTTVVETDDMVRRVFANALKEMIKRQLAVSINYERDGIAYDAIFVPKETVGNDE